MVRDQYFFPGILGIFINPAYFARKSVYETLLRFAPRVSGRLLDAGCGSKPYQHLFKNVTNYIGMEFDSKENRERKGPDIFYDGKTFPFANDSFESVLSTEVLEHVFNPDQHIQEIKRVLKPKGMLLLTTPLIWGEHQEPYDYGRYTSFGLCDILKRNGFEIIEYRKNMTGILVAFVILTIYMRTLLDVRNYYLKTALNIVFISPITILGYFLSLILPSDDRIYIGNAVLAQKR